MFLYFYPNPNLYPNNNILPQHEYCFYSSWSAIISILYALYKRLYVFALLNLYVLITSLFFWKKPQKGLRRKIDFVITNITFLYHIYLAMIINCYSYLFNSIIIIYLFFYCRECLVKKNYKLSSKIWSFVHLFANINNIILYNQLYKYILE